MSTTVTLLILFLVALGIVFIGGMWTARHHRAQINAKLDRIHGVVNIVRDKIDQIKKI